jgi:hypothetical protein
MELKKSLNKPIILLKILLTLVAFNPGNTLLFSQVQKLFDSNAPIVLTLKYKRKEVNKDRTSKSSYHEAILKVGNDSLNATTYNIQLKTRGLFRLKSSNCSFPPLKLKLNKKEIKGTTFDGYRKLKLVLPCQKNQRYEQYILLEYLAYKIYNLLTDYSFKVRLVKLTLQDLEKKKKDYSIYAFLIEPTESLEKRNNAKKLEAKNIHPNLTDRKLMNQLALFQYLIGNTDWSVKALHNIKLLARDSLQKPVAVPYDFDFSGLVNASYALPAEHLPISSVRQRHYNGYERTFKELKDNIQVFKLKKKDIYDLVYSIKALEKRHIDETIEYFDQFYQMIDNDEIIQHKFIKNSRK